MNWGEIQVESLKKMFLNNDNLSVEKLEEYKKDKKYKTYLFAMPQACNEAINHIRTELKGNEVIKTINLEEYEGNVYNLSEIFNDFGKIVNVVSPQVQWKMINDYFLEIITPNVKIISILYEQEPTVIDLGTSITFIPEISKKYSRIIPLYIAGELYKDDDLTLSTMYMNEFLSMVEIFSKDIIRYSSNSVSTIYSIE